MWDRKSLKEKAKSDFRANRFVCILAAFLLMTAGAISGGSGGGTSAATAAGSTATKGASNPYSYNSVETGSNYFKGVAGEDDEELELDLGNPDDWGSAEEWGDEFDLDDDFYDDFNAYGDYGSSLLSAAGAALIGALAVIVLLIVVVVILLGVFIFNPITVGLRKFFVANAKDSNAGLDRNTFGFAFYNGYKNIVGAMFVTHLFTFLLACLLFVPGFIFKRYVWRMVPYILGENPDMKGSDARKLSAQMMSGHKWNTFVLDLSFIGWYLLALVTLGISSIVWTAPYHAQTDAELYLALTDRSDAATMPQASYDAPQRDAIYFDEDGNQTRVEPAATPINTEAAPQTFETVETTVSDAVEASPENLYVEDVAAEVKESAPEFVENVPKSTDENNNF